MNVLRGICYVLVTIGVLFIGFMELVNGLFFYEVNKEQIDECFERDD